MIRQHLLPLTKEYANGQYAKVQPIRIFFAERCIYYLLTRKGHSDGGTKRSLCQLMPELASSILINKKLPRAIGVVLFFTLLVSFG